MKQSVLYGILFAVPGIAISLLVTFLSTGLILGIFWLFIFGDSSWPGWVSILVPILSVCIFLVSLVVISNWGYQTGTKLEGHSKPVFRHFIYSFIATIIPVLAFVIQYTRTTDEEFPSFICSDYCQTRGYSGSSIPPEITGIRTCSCLNDNGIEDITIELDKIIDTK